MGIADSIIPEPVGGAHRNPHTAAELLKAAVIGALRELRSIPLDRLIDERYRRYMAIGVWTTAGESGGAGNGMM
jgi:acetyl-CoA carboxylase carboxyl transferase subunit alpha